MFPFGPYFIYTLERPIVLGSVGGRGSKEKWGERRSSHLCLGPYIHESWYKYGSKKKRYGKWNSHLVNKRWDKGNFIGSQIFNTHFWKMAETAPTWNPIRSGLILASFFFGRVLINVRIGFKINSIIYLSNREIRCQTHIPWAIHALIYLANSVSIYCAGFLFHWDQYTIIFWVPYLTHCCWIFE